MTDDRDPICERLGDLAAQSAAGSDRLPDAQAWARIGEKLDRQPTWRSPRRLVPALVLCVAIAAGTGFLLWSSRPLGYRVQGCTQTADGVDCTTRGSLAFADGTEVVLDPGARLRVVTFARGAELSLEDGAASLAVVHRARGHWAVLAGPFRVQVTGTRFSVGWRRGPQVLDVAVREGEVRVSGGTLAHAAVLRPGQSLHAEAHPGENGPRQARTAESPPAAHEPTAPAGPNPTASVAAPDLSAIRARTAARGSRQRIASNGESSAASNENPSQGAQGTEARPPTHAALPVEPIPVRPEPASWSSDRADHPSWASAGSLGVTPPETVPVAKPKTNQILLGSKGQLVGAMTGRTWLARGEGTTLSSPLLDEEHGTLLPQRDGLCASGTVAGLVCVNIPHARCNWDRNWGVVIGFDTRADGLAWGEDAARAIAVEFHGRSSSYRLTAHRKGDSWQNNYCIDNYKSGQMVTPSMFKSRCWEDQGDVLPDFKSVDQFGLQFMSGMEYVAFHYCISGIRQER